MKTNVLVKSTFILWVFNVCLWWGGVSEAGQPDFVLKPGEKGGDEGQFISPVGIAVDSKGNVYVGDVGNYRLQRLCDRRDC